jgi:hypothetical protein
MKNGSRNGDSGLSLDPLANAIADRVVEKLRAASPQGSETSTEVSPRLLSVKDGAKYIGRSEHSARHLIRSGKLPCVQIDDRIFLDIRDLDRIIDSAKRTAE